MSFDTVILKPTDWNASDLASVESVLDIGTPETVTRILELVFPGCTTEEFRSGDEYSLDVIQSGNPVSSIHLTLRFGAAWSEASKSLFISLVSTLCNELKSQAFAVSDNSRIEFPITS